MIERFSTELENVRHVSSAISYDGRGSTTKLIDSMSEYGLKQLDNLLLSNNRQPGTFRGLHFQTGPDSETKLISCISGQLMDYLVDLRPKSKTFGRWTKVRLDSSDPSCLIIPRGVAHGYQTLDADTTVLYVIDVKYNPESQKVLSVFDEDLSITLELDIKEISERDLSGLSFKEAMSFFEEM